MADIQQPKTVIDYFRQLRWDGKERIDRWLINYAGAEDSPYVRAVSRVMLVSAVRRVLHPGCKVDAVLVLEGPQGCGKTSALRMLAIDEDWFSTEVPVGAPSAEVVAATEGKWIVELSELGHMGAGDIEALKAFVSRHEDVSRQPHQRTALGVPRQFIVVGSSGQEGEFLHDVTGNRRFWPVRVQCFDLARLRDARDQLWAEALIVEACGEPLDLNGVTLESCEVRRDSDDEES